MRVVLVGSEDDRARLRSRSEDAFEVVGEFTTLSEARAADVDAEAIVLAPGHSQGVNREEEVDDPGNAGEADDAEDSDAPDATEETIQRLDRLDRAAESLTPRELEVLERLAEGLSNKAIGAKLGISDQTVKFHVAAITGKLGVTNRTEAVRTALRRGLIAL